MEANKVVVRNLVNSRFIMEERHLDWLVNIIPVTTKNRKISICIDFRDLTKACSKNKFLLPITDVMIDGICSFECLSFMDGFFWYNQINMYPNVEKDTTFKTLLGVYCYIAYCSASIT